MIPIHNNRNMDYNNTIEQNTINIKFSNPPPPYPKFSAETNAAPMKLLHIFILEIGEIAGVAEATIKQSYKQMYPKVGELFPEGFVFHTPIHQLPYQQNECDDDMYILLFYLLHNLSHNFIKPELQALSEAFTSE